MPAGRPTKKNPLMVSKIMELAKEGKTEQQIAKIIGVSQATLVNWKAKDWEFFATLKENKQLADEVVEGSLFKLATGFHYLEETATQKGDIVTIKKFQAPNSTAQIFWLKNRQPKVWRDKREEEHKFLLVKQEVASQTPTEVLLSETERLVAKLKSANVDEIK